MSLLVAQRKPRTTTETVSAVMVKWAERTRVKGGAKATFVLDGARLSDDEVADPSVLLPVLVWHADSHFTYGISPLGLGVRYLEDREALLQRSVSLDGLTRSAAEVLLFVIEAAEDARQHLPESTSVPGAVEIRPLVNQFTQSLGIEPAPANEADEQPARRPWA